MGNLERRPREEERLFKQTSGQVQSGFLHASSKSCSQITRKTNSDEIQKIKLQQKIKQKFIFLSFRSFLRTIDNIKMSHICSFMAVFLRKLDILVVAFEIAL